MMTDAFPVGLMVACSRQNGAQVLWFLILYACFLPRVVAEVVLDGSLGSADTLSGPNFEITADLGTQVDRNLFHSFHSFNLDASQSATFSGPDSVANILSRVTGGEASTIDGLLRSTIPGADFYFLNPAGVLFGPNASLDVQGSFHVSTADFIRMEDGVTFDALPSADDSVLSTAPPAAFGFLEEDPAGVSMQESVIEVPEGEALSIVGGNIEIREGSLSAPSGHINLVSTDSAGEAPFDGTDLNVGEFEKRGDITIADDGLIDTRGESGGRIFIRGGHFMADNSEINATTLGAGDGHGIDIAVTDQLNLTDTIVRSSSRSEGNAGNLDIQSGEFNLQDSAVFGSTFAAGRAGDVTVTTMGSINLSGESFITSNTLGTDDAGNSGAAGRVSISASLLDLEGSDIESVSSSDSTGDAGEIQINVDNLELRDSAQIDSSTLSSGQGGIIGITASEDIQITGRPNEEKQTGFFSVTNKSGEGGNLTVSGGGSIVMDGGRILTRTLGDANAGTLIVNANDLTLTTGAQIFAGIGNRDIGNPEGLGNGGDIFITASETISISGTDPKAGSASGIFSTAQVGKGDSGNLTVAARELLVRGGGAISVSTSSNGNSGGLMVEADRVFLSGDGTLNGTGIFAQANLESEGDAGNLKVNAGELEVRNGARISTDTFSSGTGGNLNVTADHVLLDGDGANQFTGISADAESGSGDAGDLIIESKVVEVNNRASVRANTSSDGDGGTATINTSEVLRLNNGFIGSNTFDSGDAGQVVIDAGEVEFLNEGRIFNGTDGAGDGGDVFVTADILTADATPIDHQPTFHTGIAASANPDSSGASGDIEVKAREVSLVGRGQISSSTSSNGKGGRITITATGTGTVRLNNGFIGSNTFGSGDAGQVVIDAREIEFLNEGRIFNGTDGAGDGGDVFVKADILTANATPIDHQPRFHTGIAASANLGSSGRGGKVIVNVRDINLSDGGQISSDTDGAGNAGEVSIRNGERLIVRDGLINTSTSSNANAGPLSVNVSQIEVFNGGTISASTEGTGNGGNATINATNIRLVDGGRIAATSTGTDQEIQNDRNVGRSGNISITASDSLTIQSGGTVTVETEAANAGNIKLQVERLLLLRDQGAITTSAAVEEGIGGQGNGGNITIDPDFVVLDNGSTIQANALEGMAGVVDITADFFFQSPDSIVEASAGPAGINGTVNINSPVVNIAESVAVLPESFFDASQQLSERCSTRASESMSSFVAVGRGGLPIGPEDLAPAISFDGTSTDQSSKFDSDRGNKTQPSNALARGDNTRDQFGQSDNLQGPHFATVGFGCRE